MVWKGREIGEEFQSSGLGIGGDNKGEAMSRKNIFYIFYVTTISIYLFIWEREIENALTN